MNILRKYFLWTLVLSVVIATVEVQAGSGNRKGTAGAQELLIPVGGYGTGLMGSFSSGIYGVEAIHWNPAGLAGMEASAEAMFSHMSYLADVGVEYAAVAAKLGDMGTLGLSIKSLSFGDIPVTTIDFPDGTGENYSPTYITLGLTFSRRMTDRILFGTNVKFISEQIMRQSASAVAFDFGLQYKAGVSGFRFGVVMKNLGTSLTFDGPDLEHTVQVPGTEPGSQPRPLRLPSQAADLPSTLEFGLSYETSINPENSLLFTTSFVNNNFAYDDFNLGGQWSYNNTLFVRGGYVFSPDQPSSEEVFSYTLGAGIKFDLTERMNISVDYAFRPADFFDNNQIFSVRIGL